MNKINEKYKELDNLSIFYKKIGEIKGNLDDELGSSFIVKLAREIKKINSSTHF
jgi:hypothetical protein